MYRLSLYLVVVCVLAATLVMGVLSGCESGAGQTASPVPETGSGAPQTTNTTAPPHTTTSTTASPDSTSTTAGEAFPQQLFSVLQGMAGEGFDLEKWKATPAAQKLIANAENGFLYKDEMDPAILAYWEERGVKKEVHETEGEDLTWYSYTPLAALAPGNTQKYPVVFCFSLQEGNGIHHMGAEKGVITVRPAKPTVPRDGVLPADGLTPGRQLTNILTALENEGYPIDRSRIYATGHSIGGMASAWAALEFPEIVAAIAMHSSLAAFNTDPQGLGEINLVIPAEQYQKAMDYEVPVWLTVGDLDLDQLPIRTQGAIEGLNLWLEMNNCPTRLNLEESQAAASSTTDPAVKLIGVPGDKTWSKEIDGVLYHGVQYLRGDGVNVVELVGIVNHPHWPSAAYPDLAWEFMSRFSKVDGKLLIAK